MVHIDNYDGEAGNVRGTTDTAWVFIEDGVKYLVRGPRDIMKITHENEGEQYARAVPLTDTHQMDTLLIKFDAETTPKDNEARLELKLEQDFMKEEQEADKLEQQRQNLR